VFEVKDLDTLDYRLERGVLWATDAQAGASDQRSGSCIRWPHTPQETSPGQFLDCRLLAPELESYGKTCQPTPTVAAHRRLQRHRREVLKHLIIASRGGPEGIRTPGLQRDRLAC
jgi:hypothetical protein